MGDRHGRVMADATRDDEADLYRPNPARIYDYALGGYANFTADRAAFEALVDVYPDAQHGPRANRAFLRRAVTFLARQGIDRFLDVGAGLPTAGNVHEIAQRVNPRARVVYADNDPIAVGHGQDILARDKPPYVAVIEADLRDPAALLAHPETRWLRAALSASTRAAADGGAALPARRRRGAPGGGRAQGGAAGRQLPGYLARDLRGGSAGDAGRLHAPVRAHDQPAGLPAARGD